MAILHNNVVPALPTGEYTIDQSLRFEDGSSAYLSRTPASAGNRKTWTWSGWVKLGGTYDESRMLLAAGETDFSTNTYFMMRNDSRIQFGNSGSGVNKYWQTVNQYFRDPSAWYHIVVAIDTTQGTDTDRIKVYVNGSQSTLTQLGDGQFSLNQETYWNLNSGVHAIGGGQAGNNTHDGYLSEVHFIDGQALTPDYFGEVDETYGHWKPIRYTGTYGTNGFYLPFQGTFYNDASGNGNNWTANNLATTDVVLDSPTNNFCTMNPLAYRSAVGPVGLSEGNLRVVQPNSTRGLGSFTVDSGKWYWEIFIENNGTVVNHDYRGVIDINWAQSDTGTRASFTYNSYNGTYQINTGSFTASDIGTANNPDIIGFAWDADNGYMTVSVNGVAGTTITGLTTGIPMCPYVACDYNTVDIMNFGQDSSFAGNKTAQNNTDANGYGDFYYSPPSGFLALCTANLSDPAVVPGENFNTVLYTGNDVAHDITGVGFQPDFVWVKSRSNPNGHRLADSVRGATKTLFSNFTYAEDTADCFDAFVSDGFTVGTDGDTNGNAKTFVAWNWKADNTSGSSNTDGSITSTVAANTSAGFSVITFTGTGSDGTVGHGLSQAPDMLIFMRRDTSGSDHIVYHSALGATKNLRFNNTDAVRTDSTFFLDTEPTSSVFTLGGTRWASGSTRVCYAFHSVDGYSKFGSYTGNGSSDGPFVYTGFRPAWVMVKRTDATDEWAISDGERNPYNVNNLALFANLSNAESGSNNIADFTSNGFKIRGTPSWSNTSGGTYIYMAFAETDFKFSNAR